MKTKRIRWRCLSVLLAVGLWPADKVVGADDASLPKDVPSLVKLLADEDPKLRASAAKELGRMRGKAAAAVPELVAMLGDEEIGEPQPPMPAAGKWEILTGTAWGRITDVNLTDPQRGWLTFDDGSLLTTHNGGKTWRNVSVPEAACVPGGIGAIRMLQRPDGSSFGWAVTQTGRIFHTNDGTSWQRQKSPEPELRLLPGYTHLTMGKGYVQCLEILDERHAWIGGVGMLWRTTDGGKSWSALVSTTASHLPIAPSSSIRFLHFRDENNGSALRQGQIALQSLVTEDAGRTWKMAQTKEAAPSGWKTTIFRSGRAVRFYCGKQLVYGHGDLPIDETAVKSLLTRNTDAYGQQLAEQWWERQYAIVSKDVFALLAWIPYTTFLDATTDGGKTWRRSYLGGGWPGNATCGIRRIQFLNPRLGWGVGNGGRISHTIDGGDTWVHTYLPVDADFNAICFVDERTGWLAGRVPAEGRLARPARAGRVWRTLDGGVTWEQISEVKNACQGPHICPEAIQNLVFVGRTNGWAVTHASTKDPVNVAKGWHNDYGRVLRTNDGGRHWSQLYLGLPLRGLVHKDGRFLAASYDHWSLRSDDGATWELIASKHVENARFAFADTNHIFFADGSGKLGRSSDGGATWTVRDLDPTAVPKNRVRLSAIGFADVSVGWCFGYREEKGPGDNVLVAYRTNNGGETWTAEALPVAPYAKPDRIFDACVVDKDHVYVAAKEILRFKPEEKPCGTSISTRKPRPGSVEFSGELPTP